MHKKIKNVYEGLKGLPETLIKALLWVKMKYQTNPLSHQPGGTDVVVEYHNKTVLGYKRIKDPKAYIKRIWENEHRKMMQDYKNWSRTKQLEEIKKEFKSIYARKYKKEDSESVPFKEIWNSETSDKLPWEILREYNTRTEPTNTVAPITESPKVTISESFDKVTNQVIKEQVLQALSDVFNTNTKTTIAKMNAYALTSGVLFNVKRYLDADGNPYKVSDTRELLRVTVETENGTISFFAEGPIGNVNKHNLLIYKKAGSERRDKTNQVVGVYDHNSFYLEMRKGDSDTYSDTLL